MEEEEKGKKNIQLPWPAWLLALMLLLLYKFLGGLCALKCENSLVPSLFSLMIFEEVHDSLELRVGKSR